MQHCRLQALLLRCVSTQALKAASEHKAQEPLLLRQGVLPALGAMLRGGHLMLLQAWPLERGGGLPGARNLLTSVAALLLAPLLPRAKTAPAQLQQLQEVSLGAHVTAPTELAVTQYVPQTAQRRTSGLPAGPGAGRRAACAIGMLPIAQHAAGSAEAGHARRGWPRMAWWQQWPER